VKNWPGFILMGKRLENEDGMKEENPTGANDQHTKPTLTSAATRDIADATRAPKSEATFIFAATLRKEPESNKRVPVGAPV